MNPRNSTMFHRDTGHAVTGLLMQTYGGVATKLLDAGIDLTREMRTVDGDLVRVIALDTDHKFGIVGEIIDEAARVCWLARWNLNGTYCGTLEAIEKHSIAKNSATVGKTGARLPAGVKYFEQVNPVHDMGLDEAAPAPSSSMLGSIAEELRKAGHTVIELTIPPRKKEVNQNGAALDAAPARKEAGRPDTSEILRHAQRVLSDERNFPVPDRLSTDGKTAFIRGLIDAHYAHCDEVTRAYVTCAINSRVGRFRWYSMAPSDTPPDDEIVEAARILNETEKPFHAMISPVLAKLYEIGGLADSELLARLKRVDEVQKELRRRG
jgi:hypothetical protein